MKTGTKMLAAVNVVAAKPGCSMMQVAAAIGPNGSLQYGYRSVHRAIKAGLLIRRAPSTPQRKCDLYTAEQVARLNEMDRCEGPVL